MRMELKYLERWTLPSGYAGEVWPDYYSAGIGQCRDSGALDRANFAAMLRALGGESETVIVVHEGHWAVGWVDWIAIHQDDDKALAIADDIIRRLQDHPVIDEDVFAEYEDEDCAQTWAHSYNARDRARYLREHVHQIYPSRGETAYRMLRAAIKGDWSAAANMLPCPSDILS